MGGQWPKGLDLERAPANGYLFYVGQRPSTETQGNFISTGSMNQDGVDYRPIINISNRFNEVFFSDAKLPKINRGHVNDGWRVANVFLVSNGDTALLPTQ